MRFSTSAVSPRTHTAESVTLAEGSKAQWPQIVQPQNVVGVAVGVEAPRPRA
jgi:hypothetical protein